MINELAELLKAIAHPLRLKILILCAEREKTSRELREALNISKPLLLAHLKKLIKAGYLKQRAELDPQKLIVRKYYKTANFKILIDTNLLKEMAEKAKSGGIKSDPP